MEKKKTIKYCKSTVLQFKKIKKEGAESYYVKVLTMCQALYYFIQSMLNPFYIWENQGSNRESINFPKVTYLY